MGEEDHSGEMGGSGAVRGQVRSVCDAPRFPNDTNGSGGATRGSGGDGSDPVSVAAAAAAAAVASARRPKFPLLVASMDAAAQDLLLLRQVAWETMIVVEDSCGQRISVTMSHAPAPGQRAVRQPAC